MQVNDHQIQKFVDLLEEKIGDMVRKVERDVHHLTTTVESLRQKVEYLEAKKIKITEIKIGNLTYKLDE